MLRPRLLHALLLSFVLAGTSMAQTNQGAAVCTFANSQENPVVVSDGSGGAIIAWRDRRNSSWDIFAQHMLASGLTDPAWPDGGLVLCAAPGDQINAVIESDGSGGAFVAWQDGRAFGADDIYAQHVLANGVIAPSWPASGFAVCTASNLQSVPVISSDGSGGAIVAWQDIRSGLNAVFAQHLSSSGVDPTWLVNGVRICPVASTQVQPAIAADGAGGALVAWEDLRSGDDIYSQRIRADGSIDPTWPATGVVVCAAPGGQSATRVISDGTGGLLVTWQDVRSGPEDIYANHVLASGSTDLNWPANGLAVCAAVGQQTEPALASDGSGGAIISWKDMRSGESDVYAQHVLNTGVVDASWPLDGRVICGVAGAQSLVSVAQDGTGGAIISWVDYRKLNNDIFAQHVLAGGTIASGWPDGGLAACDAEDQQDIPAIASDGAGGAIVIWMDLRRSPGNEGGFNIYAQRLAGNGAYLFPDGEVPVIVSVRDIPGDQGGKVKLSWTASGPDKDASGLVQEYWVWRSVPPNVAPSLTASASVHVLERIPRPALGTILASELPLLSGYYWELFATQRAGRLDGYSMVCRTEMDSLASGNPPTVFFVQARNPSGTFVRNSLPDSGYSVDNLSPPAPAPLTVNYGPSFNTLHWRAPGLPDLLEYRLYRGSSDTFVPSPATLVTATAETTFVDDQGSFFYKLAAVDVHGNVSRYVSVAPDRPVAALASFLRADRSSGRLRITWFSGGNAGLTASVYRRTEEDGWRRLGAVVADGAGLLTFEDGSVEDHIRYEYRLGIVEPGGEETMLGDAWIEPLNVALAISGRIVNPSIGGRFSLTVSLPPSASADVRLFDVTGREVEALRLPGGGGGDQAVGFGSERRLRPGVYMVSVECGGASLKRRVVVLD